MITENEKLVLIAIATNEYQDGEFPVDNSIWLIDRQDIHNKLTGKQLSGVWSSLNKKELAFSQGESFPGEDDAVCEITQKGYDAIKQYLN